MLKYRHLRAHMRYLSCVSLFTLSVLIPTIVIFFKNSTFLKDRIEKSARGKNFCKSELFCARAPSMTSCRIQENRILKLEGGEVVIGHEIALPCFWEMLGTLCFLEKIFYFCEVALLITAKSISMTLNFPAILQKLISR